MLSRLRRSTLLLVAAKSSELARADSGSRSRRREPACLALPAVPILLAWVQIPEDKDSGCQPCWAGLKAPAELAPRLEENSSTEAGCPGAPVSVEPVQQSHRLAVELLMTEESRAES